MRRLLGHFFYATSLILIGMLCVIVLIFAIKLDNSPDLKPWHEIELEDDFHAGSQVDSLPGYLAVEARAFSELDEKIRDRLEPQHRFLFNRFDRGSLSDPAAVQPNWNRTFELNTSNPRGGALLLHGLSDSPYSMRSIGEQLRADGWQILAMRMPAHGTAPGALRNFHREDARAATTIGVRHLRQKLGDEAPIMIVGYSNGAALATDYALRSAHDTRLPKVDGLILMSPALEVTPMAAFAVWQARFGELFGIDKLAWSDVMPEFDPYKYNSFAVRAGDQMYRFTREINEAMLVLQKDDQAKRFPPTLVFQSVTDATVQPSGAVTRLLDRLAQNGSALVLYDINRETDAEPLYISKVGDWVTDRLAMPTNFSVTLLTNRYSGSNDVEAVMRPAGASEVTREHLGLKWPSHVFALSHVSLPFPPDDPVYGDDSKHGGKLLHIGGIELRGETHVLAIPPTLLVRLRHNPFYSYQMRRIREFADRTIEVHSRSQR